MFLLASLLSLATLKNWSSSSTTVTPSIKKIEIEDTHLKIHYQKNTDLEALSQQLVYCLHKDVQGSFSRLSCDSSLYSGTILAFGQSEDKIDVIGVYQENNEFLYIRKTEQALILSSSCITDPVWTNFPYRVYYNRIPTVSSSQKNFSHPLFWYDFLLGIFINKEKLPFVLTPKIKLFSLDMFMRWVHTQQWQMQSLLNEHGALLLRNFPVTSPEDFALIFSSSVGKIPIDYIGEGSRKKIIKGVYTSTEGPPEFHIQLHHELSCTNFPVSYISFYCEIPPLPGTGQTIIARTEDVTRELYKKNKVWKFFEGKNIKYISRHPPPGHFYTKINKTHKPWTEVFETDNKEEIERICKEKDLHYEWEGEWITLTRIVPAIRDADQHFPFSYWYNQLTLYHNNPQSRGGFLNHFLANLLYIDPSTRQYDVCLEDGTTIPQNIVYEINDVLEAQTIKFDWQKGDILILDNRKCLHGRAPSTGERRILASMTE